MTQLNPDRDLIQRVLNDGGADELPPEIMARGRVHLDALRQRMEERANMNENRGIQGLFTQWRRRVAWAVPAAALVLLGVLAVMIGSQIQNRKVYAQVVRRIREAQTMLISASTQMQGSADLKLEIAFQNTGLVRMDLAQGMRTIMDSKAMKTYSFDPAHKIMVESTLKNLPVPQGSRDPAKEIERLRHLPERASEELGEKTTSGRRLRGYRVTEGDEIDEVWIDASTRELEWIDSYSKAFPGIKVTMSNFRFDPALPADYFSTALPAGYKRQTFDIDLGNSNVDDFLMLLSALLELSPDMSFPPSMNPVEIQKMANEYGKQAKAKGKKPEARGPLGKKLRSSNPAEQMKAAQGAARGMIFLISMKPENDWHYVGAGVKYGDAKTPIAWFKPTGSKTYKVIYGDLTVKDEPPEAVPTPKPEGSSK